MISCATHYRSNIFAEEDFIVELKKPINRGGVVETAVQGLLFGANYLLEKSINSLFNSYSQTISINDYYNNDLGKVEKSYNQIVIKKYSKPNESEDTNRLSELVRSEILSMPESRGNPNSLTEKDVFRVKNEDILNFHAVIELISHPENPGITRLSFNELRVLFSKTRIFSDENLNVKISILIEGQWRGEDGSPKKTILIEQKYDFKNLEYGVYNQIKKPVLSPWYFDIPIFSDVEDVSKFGILRISVKLDEYEGSKSKYINKLPSILENNKTEIINSGTATLIKIMN